MEFEIKFYYDSKGSSPIEEFLQELKRSNQLLAEHTFKALGKLRYRFYHTEPLSKYIEPGLWEVRVRSGTNILRIFYTFNKGKIVLLLHIFIKKGQKTPRKELGIARKRLREIPMQEAN